jgi:Thaumatin family
MNDRILPAGRPGRRPRALGRALMLAGALALLFQSAAQAQTTCLSVRNNCSFPVWMASLNNSGQPPLADGIVRLNRNDVHDYAIPAAGWAGRLWPKTGCDANGRNCAAGEAVPPCPPTGCQPPADSKVEFNFARLSSSDSSWYDITLVDGFSLPFRIAPRGGGGGSCVPTSCALSVATCPQNEIQGLGNLRVVRNGAVVQCLSPCKRWNWPPPIGLGNPEQQGLGKAVCCPTPPVSAGECQAGIVVQTRYVQAVRAACPTAYSFAYDDRAGLHTCSANTAFDVTLCP